MYLIRMYLYALLLLHPAISKTNQKKTISRSLLPTTIYLNNYYYYREIIYLN
jgi:hypothetical protein